MAKCDCCGCVIAEDYGTSEVTGEGSSTDPYVVSLVDETWQRPAARVRRTTDQLISHNIFVPISFDTEVFDTGGFWVIGSPTLFTITEAGMYAFGGCVRWGVNAEGTREVGFRKNGSTILLVNDQPVDATNGATVSPWQAASYQAPLAPGETLELVVRQEASGGAALNTFTEADDSQVFWIVYLGRVI